MFAAVAIDGDSSQGNHLSEPKRCSDKPGHLSRPPPLGSLYLGRSPVRCFRRLARKAAISAIPARGTAKSRNSNEPSPPSGDTPNSFSMKSSICNPPLAEISAATARRHPGHSRRRGGGRPTGSRAWPGRRASPRWDYGEPCLSEGAPWPSISFLP